MGRKKKRAKKLFANGKVLHNGLEMITKEQIAARVNHSDWGEYLDDVSAHWHWLIELGEYDDWSLETVTRIEKRVHELEDRFRRTFFQQIP